MKNLPSLRRRQALLASVLLAAAPWATAQGSPPRHYSVLSELARELLVITFQPAVGSNLDSNLRQRMPIPGGLIDRTALTMAKAHIVAKEPVSRVSTFAPLDSDVFDSRQSFTDGSVAGMPPDLQDALRQQGSSHLLLLSRYQGDAAIQFRDGKIGSGRMEGLGFYIDNQTDVSRAGEGVSGRGFLAPFVYIRATVIDAATGRVVRSRVYTRSTPVPASAGTESAHPWEALNSTQKVRMLTEMLDEALRAVVPQALERG